MHPAVAILTGPCGASSLLSYLAYIGTVKPPTDDTYTLSLSINGSHAYKSMVFHGMFQSLGIGLCYHLLRELDGWVHEADEITSLRLVYRPIRGFEEETLVELVE